MIAMVLLSASPSDRSGNMKSKLNLLRMLLPASRLVSLLESNIKEKNPDQII